MAIGIEHFRNISTSGANRVALGGPQDAPVVEAPLSFKGKVVAWKSPLRAESQTQAVENVTTRRALYDALVSAYGQQTANQVMNARFGSATNFIQDHSRLSAKTIKQVLDGADQIRLTDIRTNRQAATSFIANGSLANRFNATVGQAPPNGLNAPGHLATNPEFQAAFRREVMRHPDIGKRQLIAADLQQIADSTAQSFFQKHTERFQRTFPHLSGINNAPFHDRRTFFDSLYAQLNTGLPDPDPNGSPLRQEPALFRSTATSTLTAIENVNDLLGRQPFGIRDVQNYGFELTGAWNRLQTLEHQLTGIAANGLAADGQNLRTALLNEIATQKQKIMDKGQFCQEYLQNDPLSMKQVAYNNLIWAQAGKVMIDKEIASLGLQAGDPVRTQLENLRDNIVNTATNQHQTAPTSQRIRPDQMKTTLEQQKSSIKHDLRQAFLTASNNPQASQQLRDQLRTAARNVGDNLKSSRLEAMNTVQSWQPSVRQMVVSKGGENRTYTSEITPVSSTTGRVGRLLRAGNLLGVSAGTKNDPTNARNLQVSTLTENGRVVHKSIRHGVLDPWALPVNQRQTAAITQADQVLHLAVESSPRFRDALLNDAAGGPPHRQFKHTHVNFNLTTPVDRVVAAYNEGTFTTNQFAGFAAHNGPKTYTLDHPTSGQQDINSPQVDVDTITFSFGVNDLAQEPGKAPWNQILNAKAWANVYEHDKANLQKLVGDLKPGTTVGGYMGELMSRMDNAIANPPVGAGPTFVQDMQAAKSKLIEQINIARDIFNSEAFRDGNGDPYKMVRHTMRAIDIANEIMDLMGDETHALTQSEGCKSNKDRGGMMDVEIKAQAMIEDMGGQVLPDRPFSREDQVIYNTVLTSSGQDRNQQWNTGLPGSKNAGEAAIRINDVDAQEYAIGFAAFVKA